MCPGYQSDEDQTCETYDGQTYLLTFGIQTSYVSEAQKGRAIAVFWIIFNFGGGIGSLASFGINFHSQANTVTDGTVCTFKNTTFRAGVLIRCDLTSISHS